MNNEVIVGWGTLAMIIAGIAQGKKLSGFGWFCIGLLLGPLALFFLLFAENPNKKEKRDDDD